MIGSFRDLLGLCWVVVELGGSTLGKGGAAVLTARPPAPPPAAPWGGAGPPWWGGAGQALSYPRDSNPELALDPAP